MKDDLYIARTYKDLVDTALPLLANSDSSTKWQHYDGKDLSKGVLYKGSHPRFGTIWKLEATLDHITARKMFNYLSTSTDDSWVPHVYKSKLHRKGADWAIIQQAAKGMMSISDREMVLLRINGKQQQSVDNSSVSEADEQDKDEQQFYQIWCSVDDEMYQNFNEKSVRGNAFPGGILLKPISADKCYLTYIYNVDLNGYFPKWILDVAATSFLQSFVGAMQNQAEKIAKSSSNSNNKASSCSETSSDNVKSAKSFRKQLFSC